METKEIIKKNALNALASQIKNARKAAAQAVSAIAIIEIPRGEWTKIIEILAGNAQGTSVEYKLASLETLGYICEELPEGILNPSQVDIILSALISNIMPHVNSQEIMISALTALTFCMRFCEKNFRIESEKNTIMSNLLACCVSADSKIRQKAMQCVLEIARCFYDYIGGKTLEEIAITTFNLIKIDEAEEVALAAIEVWCSICDEEITRLKKGNPARPPHDYIKTAYIGLMGILLENLKRKSSNDEGDWTISVASACCMSLVAMIVKDQIADHVLQYIGENIGSPDWKFRNAAVLSFTSILKGPQKATMNNIISQALPTLVNLLRDPKSQVREDMAWGFAKMAEHNYEPLIEPEALSQLIPGFLAALKDKPRISNQVCFALHNLAEAARPNEAENSGPLSIYFKDLLFGLWTNAFREDAFEDGVNLANSSFAAMTHIIQYSAPDVQPNIMNALQLLLEELDNTIKPEYRMKTRSQEYQSYLCSVLQPTFVKLTGKIGPDIIERFVNSLINTFNIRKDVYEEGILGFTGLVIAVGPDIWPYMEKFGPFLIYALGKTDEPGLCRVSVGCLGDLSRAVEDKMSKYFGDIMPILMNFLRNPDTDRSIKLVIISILSDFAMSTNKQFLPYLKEVLEILKSAATMTIQPYTDEDPEIGEYIQKLKENIIEAYIGIVYGVKEAHDTSILDTYVPDMFKYLETICNGEIGEDMEFIKQIVGLIGDLADLYGGRIKDLLIQPFITRIIGIISKATNKEYKQVAEWTKLCIAKAQKMP